MIASSFWLPPDISEHGSQIDIIIKYLHWFMAILFVAWGSYFLYCLVRFRAGANPKATYGDAKAKPSKVAEIVVIVIEAALLVGFSIPVWAYYRSEPPTNADNPLTVRVVAQQFAWNIHYPGKDGVFGKTRPELVDEALNPIGLVDASEDPAAGDDYVSVNIFHAPKGRDILVRLSSKDVIHSFAVPLLRVKQDAVPGMEIPIWFKAEKTNEEAQEMMKRAFELPASAEGAEAERFIKENRLRVTMADYGSVPKGATLNAEHLKTLIAAGTTSVELAPGFPVNIQCAQLCGLGHYRMKGQMKIYEPEDFEAWYSSAGEVEVFDEDEFDDE
ncbi:MAG TPA: cytochrome c oxidase subunit II [Phycisphaerae bacterium]|nr:cytochrome c oxidase subunit II [Phycisphaerae bacterium]